MARVIEADLKLKDNASKDIKKFSQNTNTAFDKISTEAKKVNSQMSKISTAVNGIATSTKTSFNKATADINKYNTSIKQAEASIKRLATESKAVKGVSATAGSVSGGVGGLASGSLAAGAIGGAAISSMGGGIKETTKKFVNDLVTAYNNLDVAAKAAGRSVTAAEYKAVEAQFKPVVKQIESAKASTNNLEKANNNLNNSASKGIPVWAKLAAAIYAVYKVATITYQAYAEQIVAETKLSGVLKATGYTAGYTTAQLKEIAKSLQDTTVFEDKVILNTMALISSFRNVRGDTFIEATKAVLDMATVMDTDTKSAAIQLGKALNDPIKGVSALAEVGVTFSTQQKQQIKDFMAVNDIASAQKVILSELTNEFGGVAEAMAKTDVGKVSQMANAWIDLKEKVGLFVTAVVNKMSPMFTWLMKSISVVVDGLNKMMNVDIPTSMTSADQELAKLQERLAKNQKSINELVNQKGALGGDDSGSTEFIAMLYKQIEKDKARIELLEGFMEKNISETNKVELGKITPFVVNDEDAEAQANKLIDLRKRLAVEMVGVQQGQFAQEIALINQRRQEELKIEGLVLADKIKINAVANNEIKKIYEEQAEYKRQALEKELQKQQEYVDAIKNMEISIAEIKGNYREADLLALELWYSQQLELLKGNKEAESKLNELYGLQRQELLKTDTQKWIDETNKMKITWADMAENMSRSMSSGFDSMLDGTKSLKEGFDDMLKSMVNNLIKMVAEMYIYKAVAAGMSWAGGTSWGGQMGFRDGGITPKLPGAADGNVFSGPTSGYPVMMHGNEAVIPLKHGKVPVDLNNGKGSRAATINMYISTPDASSFKRSRAQIMADVRRSVG